MSEGSLTLTAEQLIALTDRCQPAAQARRLREMGIPHVYTKGKPVKVLHSALERRAGSAAPRRRDGYAPEPDYQAFDPR